MKKFSIEDCQSLFPHFLDTSDFKPKTRSTFRAGLRALAAWCHESGIDTPDTASINQWKSFLISHYQTATASTYLSAVKVFFKWLSHQGQNKDIAACIRGVRMEKVFKKDCLSEAETIQTLALLEQRMAHGGEAALRDFTIVLLIVSCGLRVSEVSALDANDIASVTGEPVIWVHGKGRDGKVDFVPITPALRDLLYHYMGKRASVPHGMPIFISYGHNSHGRRLSSRSVSRIVKDAMVAAGYDSPKLTAHSLRHTAVTLALKAGATLQQVQQFARHRGYESTLRYAHNLEHARNPCTELVMKLLGRADFHGIPPHSSPNPLNGTVCACPKHSPTCTSPATQPHDTQVKCLCQPPGSGAIRHCPAFSALP